MLGPFATASRYIAIHQMSLLTPPAHRFPRQRQRRRQQRQRVTERTAMAPWNRSKKCVFGCFHTAEKREQFACIDLELWLVTLTYKVSRWTKCGEYPRIIKGHSVRKLSTGHSIEVNQYAVGNDQSSRRRQRFNEWLTGKPDGGRSQQSRDILTTCPAPAPTRQQGARHTGKYGWK